MIIYITVMNNQQIKNYIRYVGVRWKMGFGCWTSNAVSRQIKGYKGKGEREQRGECWEDCIVRESWFWRDM